MFENTALPTQHIYFNPKTCIKKKDINISSGSSFCLFSGRNTCFIPWDQLATGHFGNGPSNQEHSPWCKRSKARWRWTTTAPGHWYDTGHSEGVKYKVSQIASCCEGITLQGINISHLGKRKIIFKMPFLGDMLVPWRVSSWWLQPTPFELICLSNWIISPGKVFEKKCLKPAPSYLYSVSSPKPCWILGCNSKCYTLAHNWGDERRVCWDCISITTGEWHVVVGRWRTYLKKTCASQSGKHFPKNFGVK